jgi:hypothetical protein
VPEPDEDATRCPKPSDIGRNGSRKLTTDIEAESSAVIGSSRIEKCADGHPEAHRQPEQLVRDDVAIPQLHGADGRAAPIVTKVPHAKREVMLRHGLQKAVRPDIRRQGD